MSARLSIGLRAQRGQSLTEFVIIALVLVPLFLALPLLAKYQDIAQATEMAGRYVAFDGTTRNPGTSAWKTPEQLNGEVQRRFFSNPDAPIKTGDTPGDFKAHQNLYWRDPEDKSLIRNFGSDIRISFGESLAADRGAAFKSSHDGDPFIVARNQLNLENTGMYRGNVTVTLANLSSNLVGPTKSYDFFKNVNLRMTRHTTVLVDAWSAKSAADVEDHLKNPLIYPAVAVGPVINPLVDAGVAIMEMPRYLPGVCLNCGTKVGELDYWRDEVPADRIR